MGEAAAAALAANMRVAHVEKIRKYTTHDWCGVVVVSEEQVSWKAKFDNAPEKGTLADASL